MSLLVIVVFNTPVAFNYENLIMYILNVVIIVTFEEIFLIREHVLKQQSYENAIAVLFSVPILPTQYAVVWRLCFCMV